MLSTKEPLLVLRIAADSKADGGTDNEEEAIEVASLVAEASAVCGRTQETLQKEFDAAAALVSWLGVASTPLSCARPPNGFVF